MEDYDVRLPDYEINDVYDTSQRSGRLYSWGLDFLKSREVQSISDGTGTVVFVIDTEDQSFNPLFKNYPEYSGRFTNELPEVKSEGGHGLHVSDTIQQISPGAVIGMIKALRNEGVGYSIWIANAIRYVADLQLNREHIGFTKIINLSLGSDSPAESIRSAIQYARAKGVDIFAAAGNDGKEVDYPGAFSDLVITVGAIDQGGKVTYFSSRGPEVDLVAPGLDIVAAFKDGQASLSGTSMATPHAVGIACLILGFKKMNILELFMTKYATDIGLPGREDDSGFGVPIATAYFEQDPIPEPEPQPEPQPGTNKFPILITVIIVVVITVVLLIVFL